MDVYQIITDRIIEQLERGCVSWHKPWGSIGAPENLVSKKTNRGINVWLLAAQGYASPYWATIRQINELRMRPQERDGNRRGLLESLRRWRRSEGQRA
jgi:antirestriction protein ArdC